MTVFSLIVKPAFVVFSFAAVSFGLVLIKHGMTIVRTQRTPKGPGNWSNLKGKQAASAGRILIYGGVLWSVLGILALLAVLLD